jgi:hypothetical protein
LGLSSQSTSAEGNADIGLYGATTAFNSNGFSVGGGTSNQAFVNLSTVTYVAWQWKAGGAAVTNTSGTISSQVSANPTAGFSVVTYTGNGTTGATFGHGLGVTPSMVIIKKRSTGTAGNWIVYHTSTGINQYLYLNSTAASAGATPTWGVSSTVITLQQSFNDYNTSTAPYVAYCWAPVAGYSAFGSYTGNGNANGPFVFTGFKPRFILIRRTDSLGGWKIYNTSGLNYNAIDTSLEAHDSGAEATSTNFNMDLLSNGFKIRTTYTDFNASSATYIYMAFAESPFKYANAR